MEFLQENLNLKAKAERLHAKFYNQIETLKKADIEGYRRRIEEEPDIQAQSGIMRRFLETNLPAAAILLDKLLEKSKRDPLEHLEWLFHRHSVAMSLESFKKARTIAEEAHSRAKEFRAQCPDSKPAYKALLKACVHLLTVCRYQGLLKDAQVYLEEAEAIAEDSEDQHLLLVMRGDLLLARGRLNEAIEKCFNPLLQQDLTDVNRGILLQKMGNACRSAARWGQAKDNLRVSIRIARTLKDQISEHDRLTDLGNVYRSEGRISDALELQLWHMGYAFKRGDLWGLTVACFNTGFAYYSVNPNPDLHRALLFLSLKYELAKTTDNEPLRGMALNNLGKVFCALGQHEMALKVMEESLEVAKKTLNAAGEGMAYGNIGTACRSLGRYEAAVVNHTKYLENASGRGDDGGVAIMQRELAIDYVCMEDLELAECQVRNAISTLEVIRNKLGSEDSSKIANFDKNQAETYSLLQAILARRGKFAEALALSELARSRALTDIVRDKLVKTSGLHSSSWICSSDVVSRWPDLVEEILSDYHLMADELQTNFVVYSVLKDYDSSGVSQQWLYTWLVLSAQAAGEGERLHFRRVVLGDAAKDSHLGNGGFFASLTRSFVLSSREHHVEETPTEESSSPKEKEELPPPDTPEVKELISFLNSLFLSEESTCVGEKVVEASNERTAPESQPEQDDRLEMPLKRVLDPGTWKLEGLQQLQRLYQVCVAPIDDCLPRNCEEHTPHVTIIPHEFLFSVPFCCLYDKEQYLVERFALGQAPSLRALCLLHHRLKDLRTRQGQRELKMLAIGDPILSQLDAEELPFSGEEAENVRTAFGTERCQLALRGEATKGLLLSEMKNVDMLHVASHACVQNPKAKGAITEGDYSMQGCILLASSGDDNFGVVLSAEIAAVDCTCQFVTLSCCETGLGKLTSDGVVGLYRAFFAAGAAAVLVTLWKIRDDITSIFMKRFYTEFKVTGSASRSLRSAMIFCIREEDLPPQQWAAFSIVGADA